LRDRSRWRGSPTPLSDRVVLTRIPRRKERARIDWSAARHDLEVQVISGRAAALTLKSERLPGDDLNVVARSESFEMSVQKRQVAADELAVCAETTRMTRWKCTLHRRTAFLMECSRPDCDDKRRGRTHDVDSRVRMFPRRVTEPLTCVEPDAGHRRANGRTGQRRTGLCRRRWET